jgi:hypothetical protein
VVFPGDVEIFNQAMNYYYWTQQHRQDTAACIVQSLTAQEVSIAVAHLKLEYDRQVDQIGYGGDLEYQAWSFA